MLRRWRYLIPKGFCMSWKEPSERHSDDLIAAIDRIGHDINRTLAVGFKLVAAAIQAAKQGVDNSAVIEADAKKLRDLADDLTKSLHH